MQENSFCRRGRFLKKRRQKGKTPLSDKAATFQYVCFNRRGGELHFDYEQTLQVGAERAFSNVRFELSYMVQYTKCGKIYTVRKENKNKWKQ